MKSSKKPDLTIVIPAYLEEKRIGRSLDELAAFLKRDDFFGHKKVEVIVVTADAPDRTHEIAVAKLKLFECSQLLTPGPKAGKGRDVQYGMSRAKGKVIVYMDADLSTPLCHLEKFYQAIEKSGCDMVIGTRNLLRHHPNPLRRVISNFGNVLFRIVSGLWIEDSQCGFKMFTEAASHVCFSKLRIMGWGFDMEILAIARANHLKLECYRINDWRDMPHSTFTDSLPRVLLRSLSDLGHIGIRRLTGKL